MSKFSFLAILGMGSAGSIMFVGLAFLFITPWKINLKKAKTEYQRLNIFGERDIYIHMFYFGFFVFAISMIGFIFS